MRSISLKSIYVGLFVVSSLFVFGCSSGSQGIKKTGFCSSKYDPLKVDKDNKYIDKKILKPGEKFTPMPLEYKYSGFDYFFADDSRQGFKIHLRQSKDSLTGEVKEGELDIVCVGGRALKQDMEPITHSFTFVSDLLVDETETVKIKTRTITFDLRPRPSGKEWLVKTMVIDNPEYVVGSPESFYSGFDESEQYFLNLKSNREKFQLLNRLNNVARDEKSGKSLNYTVRTLVEMKTNHIEE